MHNRTHKLMGTALLLALGAMLLPGGRADAFVHIRKPELNQEQVSKNWQPLVVDKTGIYALDLGSAARIWQRLSPEQPDSVQAASVIIRCQQFDKTEEAVLKHYYLCPKLGLLQQLSEVRLSPNGRRQILWQKSYDYANWSKPEPDSAEGKLLRYVPDYLNPENSEVEMTVASLEEVGELAAAAKEALWAKAAEYRREPKLYLHWTAMPYGRFFPSYHINIDQDGMIYLSTRDFSKLVAGTWKRNNGAVNLTICGCTGCSPKTLGPQPPTRAQIETMARVIAALSEGLAIPVDKQHVLTHGEAANNEDNLQPPPHQPYPWWNDSYGDHDTRGDLEYLGTPESPAYAPTDPNKQEQRGGSVLRAMARDYMEGKSAFP